MSLVIIGASVAGVATARQLRNKGYGGSIALVEAQPHLPYDKPPLSKQVLSAAGGEAVQLIPAEQLDGLGLDLQLGVSASSLDCSDRVVRTSEDVQLHFDKLVIATGVVPRTLPFRVPPGVYTLRTIDDALAIRTELAAATRLVIVGAGFIGAELATTARAYGIEVVIIETQKVPMEHLFGREVASELSELHAVNGVQLVTDAEVAGFESSRRPDGCERVSSVLLSDGSSFAADFVVVAIGTRPATEWLASSGLDVHDGLPCDAELRVKGADDVWAAGDIARWPHGFYDSDLRIEHWTNAMDHAAIVTASILGLPAPDPQVPYVWSDQYGQRLQIVGQPRRGSLAAKVGGLGPGQRYAAAFTNSAGQVVGALCLNYPRAMMAYRAAIKERDVLDKVTLP